VLRCLLPRALDETPESARIALVPICKSCGDEVEELTTVKVGGKSRKLCEDCADRAREQDDVAEQSESVVQQMMGFKGRR
jgi:ribosome-binding protein aMBF1 (putative translation factor)